MVFDTKKILKGQTNSNLKMSGYNQLTVTGTVAADAEG